MAITQTSGDTQATQATDLFGQLLEFTYNGISAPIVSFKEACSHDQAEHKKTDRDGSSSEGTGRNAFTYHARIAFINGLKRGPAETWQNLYPSTYNNFVNELLKRDTGFLGHPERGLIDVKVISWESELVADQRGGRYVDVVFRETDDTTSTIAPVANLASAAATLTETLGALDPPLPIMNDGLSLFDLISDIASIGSTLDLLEMEISLRIDRMISTVDSLFDSVSVQGNPTILPMITAVSGALRDQKSKLLTLDQPVGFHETSKQQTTANLANFLKNSVEDMLKLNPQLGGMAIIPVASVVRFYK